MEKLEHTLIDIIQEQQIKLGYVKESIRLYFPESSIQYLLNQSQHVIGDDLDKKLKEALINLSPHLGNIKFNSKEGRYALIIPVEASTFVYNHIAENLFLEELIQLFSSHQVSLEQVKKLFEKYDPDYVCKKEDGIEFDYLFYFVNYEEDKYYYCVKFDEGHCSYHRFNAHDIEDILLEK